jgi:hypothetical protein
MANHRITYNTSSIRVIALIMCVLYSLLGITTTVLHPYFHQHDQSFTCECPDKSVVHFHSSRFDNNFHENCPVCQQGNFLSLINSVSDNYNFIFAVKTQDFSLYSRKYSSTEFSISSPRAPPICL